MTTLSVGEQEESLFVRNEQPSAKLQSSESFNGVNSIHRIYSASSSITLPTLHKQQREPYRSLSTHDLILSNQPRSAKSINTDLLRNQSDKALDEQIFLLWQKEQDKRMQQLNEIKTMEFEKLKIRYETKLYELEHNYGQLEIRFGQINEENKRLKIELEHEKQHNRIEQTSLQNHLKDLKSNIERKIHDTNSLHENEKQEIKQQHTRMYQDVLDETNQMLKRMEHDHKNQQATNESIIEEMEKRMIDLRANVDFLQQLKLRYEEDKTKLTKTNDQLQLQVQELINKQRHADRDHADKIQRYENELKSAHIRCESSIDLLRKENDVLKSKSTKTIEELEKRLTTITDQFHELEIAFENKLHEQKLNYQNNIQQNENDYEKKLQKLRHELKEQNHNFNLSIQHYEQIQVDLQREKDQLKMHFEHQMKEMKEKMQDNEQLSINKLKREYEQANQQNQAKLRETFTKEFEQLKHEYETIIERHKQKTEADFQKIDQLAVETRREFELEKQQIVNEYEQFIQKIEKKNGLKLQEYEKRIEQLVTQAQGQLTSIEDEFQARDAKQQAVINDQHKTIQTMKDEETQAKLFYEKQYKNLSEQCLREKEEIKTQFDACMKNLEKNFSTLALKKEQLEHKLTYLKEQHKHELVECRLSYENSMKGLLSNDVRLDLENTIHALKQQVVYLQQRIAFLQQELEQYIKVYGHRPASK